MVKYVFYIEIENDAESSPSPTTIVEWRNLTKHTAVMMYNATAKNCHYLSNPLHSYGWEEQK